jgi:hypothetical protein
MKSLFRPGRNVRSPRRWWEEKDDDERAVLRCGGIILGILFLMFSMMWYFDPSMNQHACSYWGILR